jgi:hypothetical protein
VADPANGLLPALVYPIVRLIKGPTRLEKDLQRELQYARIVRRGDRPEPGRVDAFIGKVAAHAGEIRVVKRLEEFAAQLRPPVLGDREFLEHTHIPVEQSGPDERTLAHIPDRSGGGQDKGGWIQPAHARCIVAGIIAQRIAAHLHTTISIQGGLRNIFSRENSCVGRSRHRRGKHRRLLSLAEQPVAERSWWRR